MNFLIYMVGRGAGRAEAGLRPTPRELLLARAAGAGAGGDFEEALAAYKQLGRATGLTAVDLLVRGHVQLAMGRELGAHHDFSRGADRLMSRRTSEGDAAGMSIERLLDQAEKYLHRGRFVRAEEVLQEARTLLDLLMAAHAGICLTGGADLGGALLPLAKLSDISLRLLARTHLAAHVADSLRRRQLREDLATWATTANSVDALLASEYQRLTAACAGLPGHAESHFRLGLVARAVAEPEFAGVAFAKTLRFFPHHVPSAVKLAATLMQLGRPAGIEAALRGAFAVPVATLKLFAAFARAAGETAAFDRTAGVISAARGEETVVRANLAFALSELALLDPVRSAWREAVNAE